MLHCSETGGWNPEEDHYQCLKVSPAYALGPLLEFCNGFYQGLCSVTVWDKSLLLKCFCWGSLHEEDFNTSCIKQNSLATFVQEKKEVSGVPASRELLPFSRLNKRAESWEGALFSWEFQPWVLVFLPTINAVPMQTDIPSLSNQLSVKLFPGRQWQEQAWEESLPHAITIKDLKTCSPALSLSGPSQRLSPLSLQDSETEARQNLITLIKSWPSLTGFTHVIKVSLK